MYISTQLRRRGFSLVEVVIAIGIVAILLSTFMAVFAPAQNNIRKALSVRDANRLASTLENEMAILRDGEDGTYSSAFEKAFEWIKDSDKPNEAVFVYQYKAQPRSENTDGTLEAYDPRGEDAIAGKDYITQTVVRGIDSSYLTNELRPGIVEGPVYVVRMTQLINDTATGGLVSGTPGVIADDAGTTVGTSADYPHAYIAFQAEFFRLKTNQFDYVTGGSWDFEKLRKPVATRNMAIRR